jgi:acetoin utilization deacetylase AcuC-like enzyme
MHEPVVADSPDLHCGGTLPYVMPSFDAEPDKPHARDMRLYYSDHFVIPLPEGHRFPMKKYALLRERVVESGLGGNGRMKVPAAATDEELATVHEEGYLARVSGGTLSPQEIRKIGFPWSPELVERSRRSVGGTLAASRAALDEGLAMNLSGGTHHAFPGHGEGFCVFNDVAVAARVLLNEKAVRRIAVLDLDVHQGNGTAFIFRGNPAVFTFSLHGANNFPFRKEPSDLDVELPDGADDAEYLEAATKGVEVALEQSDSQLAFYLAGADPWKGDRLGRLSVSKGGLEERDRLVFSACRERDIPVAVVMSGGYAPRIEDTVDIHLATVRTAVTFHGSS